MSVDERETGKDDDENNTSRTLKSNWKMNVESRR